MCQICSYALSPRQQLNQKKVLLKPKHFHVTSQSLNIITMSIRQQQQQLCEGVKNFLQHKLKVTNSNNNSSSSSSGCIERQQDGKNFKTRRNKSKVVVGDDSKRAEKGAKREREKVFIIISCGS